LRLGRPWGILLGFFDIVFSSEPFYAARRIHQLLLSRKKGMAGGTNFYFNILNGGSGFNYIAAGTAYGSKFIFRVYFFFHIDKILRTSSVRYSGLGIACSYSYG
jgi:hypothetical protein